MTEYNRFMDAKMTVAVSPDYGDDRRALVSAMLDKHPELNGLVLKNPLWQDLLAALPPWAVSEITKPPWVSK